MSTIKKYIKCFLLYLLPVLLVCSAGSCGGDDGEDLFLSVNAGDGANGQTLRLISYNILEGMKLDKGGGNVTTDYNNFVDWVKSWDPDILALQEVNKFTQTSLETLAARYNHPYVVTNVKVGDNYPVALTSKYPIEVRRKITKDVSHGTIFAQIKGVNIVVTHLWPQSYRYTSGDGLGEQYRIDETTINLDSTIRKYPTETKWLMMGDFNSVSYRDSSDLANGKSRDYRVHRLIESAGYSDALRYLHDYFQRSCPTTYGGWTPGSASASRIDFIYATPAMLRNLTRSEIIYDSFTENYSDHYPVLVEFRY